MIEHRLRVSVVPWQDPSFVQELDSLAAAELAQRALRADGYPRAVVEYHRTVDDVLHARAEWVVRRDGLEP